MPSAMSPVLDFLTPRPRNRLRKQLSKRRPGSVISNPSPRVSSETPRISRNGSPSSLDKQQQQQRSDTPHRSSLHTMPPDLSDPKWQDYVRNSSLLRPMETIPKPEHKRSRSPLKLVPELAHLAASDASPRNSESNSSVETLSPKSRTPSSGKRKYAKTPIRRIGQLEESPERYDIPRKPSDVELIAEQYRALLDMRSCESLRPRPQENYGGREEPRQEPEDPRQHSIDAIRSATTRRSPPTSSPQIQRPGTPPPLDIQDAEGSPTSDGTLVDFDLEDAIYFKPAFTPDALSPIPEDGAYSPWSSDYSSSSPRASRAASSLGLQVCMDMLTRELASAVQRNRPRTSAGSSSRAVETPPLQVWLMIEAYERMRDQISGARLPAGEVAALQDMLDMWLHALYKVHEGVADGRRFSMSAPPSEHELADGLESLELDEGCA